MHNSSSSGCGWPLSRSCSLSCCSGYSCGGEEQLLGVSHFGRGGVCLGSGGVI